MIDYSPMPPEIVDTLTKQDIAEIVRTRTRYVVEHLEDAVSSGTGSGLAPRDALDAIDTLAENITFWTAVLRQKLAAEGG